MSRHVAETALTALAGRPALVEDRYALGDPTGDMPTVIGHIRRLATADPKAEAKAWADLKTELVADYGMQPAPGDKIFAYADGIAIIPVHGLLLNRFAYSWGFATGYNFIRSQFNAALNDPDVKLIAFDINSGGGMAAGCAELSDEIYAARGTKPSVAVVDSSCYSAAYYLASAATRVVVTPTSGVGSIGVLAMRVDVTEALSKDGVKVTIVYAGANKLDFNAMVPFSADAKARLQTSIDKTYDAFVAAVARNRGIEEQAARDTEATCYDPAEALALGLIDAIQPPSAAIEAAVADLCNPDEEDPYMAKTADEMAAEQAQAVATAQAEARTAERTRIAGIQGHANAKDKGKLAAHLALATAMSIEDAAAVLAAAAPETAPVAAAAAPAPAGKNPLEAAMEQTKQPNVTAGEESEQTVEQTPKSRAASILDAQARATGRKANAAQSKH